ncbi:ArnT family glycosyltransferase [Silvibacterium sp.]|uniref:ArnT family glycosyltransferase n=1 Tax=Silvibacterium sp. TaxID=1964179 RepID=UPI0039E52BEC
MKTLARDEFRAPWLPFWIALAVRIVYMTVAHTWRFPAIEDHFSFGHEMGRIGHALATGYGYGDPFHGHTGPTAWLPPVYPLLIAASFKLFGVYSNLSAWVLLAINSLFSALTVRTVWEIARRSFSRSVATWSTWIWAIYPAAMQYAVKWVWETALTAFLFSLVLVLALRMRGIGEERHESPTLGEWLGFGFVWAVIALTNPSLLLFLPICGLWIVFGCPLRDWQSQAVKAVAAALIFIACVAPWTYRNWKSLHAFVPLRSNFGVELYLGNGPGSDGLEMGFEHPYMDPGQFALYRSMGEVPYSKMRGDKAKAYIGQHVGHFLHISLLRAYYFWAGLPRTTTRGVMKEYGPDINFDITTLLGLFGLALALRRRIPAAGLYACAFAVLPLTYYAVTISARFRHPLEPLMAIFTVYLIQSAEKRWTIWPWR